MPQKSPIRWHTEDHRAFTPYSGFIINASRTSEPGNCYQERTKKQRRVGRPFVDTPLWPLALPELLLKRSFNAIKAAVKSQEPRNERDEEAYAVCVHVRTEVLRDGEIGEQRAQFRVENTLFLPGGREALSVGRCFVLTRDELIERIANLTKSGVRPSQSVAALQQMDEHLEYFRTHRPFATLFESLRPNAPSFC